MTPSPKRPTHAADLTGRVPVSRGLPVDWEILRAGRVLDRVACPDAETAQHLATFRFGVDATVRRQGVSS